jgi:hypothetical protein
LNQQTGDAGAEPEDGDSDYGLTLEGKRWVGWAGTALALAALAYYLAALRAHAAALGEFNWGSSAALWLLICAAIYPLTYALGAAIWCLLLRSMGAQLGFRRGLSICAVSQFGKYLPGNLAHHVGRIALARREGVGVPQALLSMLLETANVLLAGTLSAMLLLSPVAETASLSFGHDKFAAIGVAILIVVALPLGLLWRRYRQRREGSPAIVFRWLPLCFGLQCGAFLLHGVLAALVVNGALGLPQSSLAALTGVFALAWVAGFVAPGVPAGIGVREAVLSMGLAPVLGAGGALALAGLLRVVSVVGDLLSFVAGLMLSRWEQRS